LSDGCLALTPLRDVACRRELDVVCRICQGDHKLRLFLTAAVLAASLVAPVTAEIRPDQAAFKELYKELVETNTTLSAGSCTLAAERMAARLKAAGYKEGDIRLFGVADHPKEDGLVAVYPGRDKKLKSIL